LHALRTPDERFADLADWPFAPHYASLVDADGTVLRMHYADEGPRDGTPVLLMHGEPSWAYLYRKIIPTLTAKGYRVIAPDLIGFGRSDKPDARDDYTYERHVAWTSQWLAQMDLSDITLFCQDWGGLIGLRLAAEHPDRFARIVASNTGLPAGDYPMPDIWHRFREAMQNAPQVDVARFVEGGCRRPMSAAARRGYDAPFPDESFKVGPRAMPGLVPIRPDDPASEANRTAWRALTASDTPVLVAFSDGDSITVDMAPILKRALPGAQGREHPTIENAGHFVQEDAGPELAAAIVTFVEATPAAR
jgi:haloalkane dehalogenase